MENTTSVLPSGCQEIWGYLSTGFHPSVVEVTFGFSCLWAQYRRVPRKRPSSWGGKCRRDLGGTAGSAAAWWVRRAR